MKFRKLLAGAAVAALTAGSASALDLTLAGIGVASVGAPGAPAVTTPVGLANESTNAAATDTAEVLLTVTTDAAIAAANNYLVGLTVTGGTFGRPVVAGDLIDGGAGGTTFTGTTVQFDGSDRTGEEGDASVRFLASAATGGTNFQIRVPVKTDCATPVTFEVSLRTEADTAIEEGTAPLRNGTTATATNINAITCVEAYSATIGTDVTVTGVNDSFVTVASNFQQFSAGVTTVAGLAADTTTVATLGTLQVTFDPTNATAPTGAAPGGIFANLAATAGPTPLTNQAPGDAEFTLTTSSRTGIAAITGTLTSATDTTAANDIDLPGGPAAVATPGAGQQAIQTVPLQATVAGTVTVVQPTTITASGATLNYDAAAGLTDESITLLSGGVLDLINYEAGICGNFDWVGDSTTSRRNVFRVTNFSQSPTLGIFATMTNSSAGLTQSTQAITPTITNSELLITDSNLTAAFGNFGRADFTLSFAADLNIDCDRLQTSPAASIVTDFGNGTGNGQDGDDN